MAKTYKIRRGADIKLIGEAAKSVEEASFPASFAIKPTDFHGMVPKMLLKEGAEVKVGTPIFYDKSNERIKFVSPVSGEVAEIVRGAKRRILEVRIVADRDQSHMASKPFEANNMTREQLIELLLESGYWPFFKQRPYDMIADPGRAPKAIFVSGFHSAPLGVDYSFLLKDRQEELQMGFDALSKLAPKVYLGLRSGESSFLNSIKNVQTNYFDGPHPAGNVGIQIHHVSPVNKGEVVWTIGLQAIAMIGSYLKHGKHDFTKVIALAGSEVKSPGYLKTWLGAAVSTIVDGRITEGDNRIISGDVLSGSKLTPQGYLGFYDDMVTVIPEGREPQFMGWLAPNFHKFSLSHAYFSWLMPNKRYRLNTNMNGEERPFVVSGTYERVLPMDILPEHLLRAILTKDLDRMEALGIYEVAPEDLALCEFACTSKVEIQRIIREGLDLAKAELG